MKTSMEIQLESTEPHTIRSYSDQSIVVRQTTLNHSCIISKHSIENSWPIHHIEEFNLEHLPSLLEHRPEVIIVGHAGKPTILHVIAAQLSQQKIGLECMSIGAACRTFNVLLSEHRAVVLGIIFA
jgi:uncharacterized protein